MGRDGDVYEQVLVRDGYPSFSPEEIARRHAAVRALAARHGARGVVLYGAGRWHSDVQYLSNWPGGREGYVVLPLEGEPVLLAQLYNHVPLAQRLSLIPDTRWAGPNSIETVAGCVRELGLERARIGLIGALPYPAYERLKGLLPEAEFLDLSRDFQQLRLIRSEEELRFFRVAAELTDRAIDALERELRPGLREYELAAIVELPFLKAGGYAGIHFMASTSMSEPGVFVPHQYQSDRVLQRGDVLITEISGHFWGYGGQIHRTFFLGEPTPEWARLHEAAVAAYEAIEAALRDGATAEDLMDAAEIIHRSGYTVFDDLVHGAHQYPAILRTWQTNHGYPKGFVYRENMVVTIQPQLTTRDRRLGLQFGETVRVTKAGTERLHRYPRQMVLIDR